MATLVTCICHRCRRPFKRKIAEAKRTKTPFCSKLCLSECYEDAESRIAYEVTSSKMHRYMYEGHKGKIPDGLLIRHKCDNPKCINPDHLEPGTHKDNTYDMVERGRQKKPCLENIHLLLRWAINNKNKIIAEYGDYYCDPSDKAEGFIQGVSFCLGSTPKIESEQVEDWNYE